MKKQSGEEAERFREESLEKDRVIEEMKERAKELEEAASKGDDILDREEYK